MPHSLRAKLSGLRYKGILEDKDYKRLRKALDKEDVLEQIQAEILNFKEKCNASDYLGCGILDILDKYKAESKNV